MKIWVSRPHEPEELTTAELVQLMRLNHADRTSNWSYHGCRSGIVEEQAAVIQELRRRGVDTAGYEIR